MNGLLDIRQVKEKTREKKRLEDKLLKLKEQNIDEWEKEREAVEGPALCQRGGDPRDRQTDRPQPG